MLTKLIFTITVIAAVVLFARMGQRRTAVRQRPVATQARGRGWIRMAAISVISLMLVASGVFIYLEWQSANEILMVKVIDTRSGRATEYRVARGKLEDRAFQAQDGRFVRLAETERMEIGGK